MLFNFG